MPVSCRARSSLRSFRICACVVRSQAWSSFAMVTSRVPSEASGEGAEGESAAREGSRRRSRERGKQRHRRPKEQHRRAECQRGLHQTACRARRVGGMPAPAATVVCALPSAVAGDHFG